MGQFEISDCHHTNIRALELFCMLGLSSL